MWVSEDGFLTLRDTFDIILSHKFNDVDEKYGGKKRMGNGTTTARSRIEALLDAKSFVEIGAAVTARSTDFNMAEKKAASDGVVTGYGMIDGNPVYVYSQDPSVLNGTVGEMHASKIVKIYEMAMKTGSPVIGLVDCAGMRLEESTDALNAFGKIYMAQSDASGVIPQITAIFGNCGGGMALLTALSDFTFMESEKAKLFVNTPNALAGNHVSKCDSASAKFQSEQAGNVDYVGSEAEIMGQIRSLVTLLPANNEDDMSYRDSKDDANRICNNLEALAADPIQFLTELGDDHLVFEAKAGYAKDMVTAFVALNGTTVGFVGNRSVLYNAQGEAEEKFEAALSVKGAEKAADFVNFCDAFSIPVVSMVSVKGFEANMCTEKNIAKAAAKLIFAFANATTPKVSLITGEAFGSAYLVMNSKSIGADMVYAWDGAKVGMMDAKSAAKIMYAGESAAVINEQAAKYDALQNSVESAAARGFVDAVITPAETRKYLIGAIELLFSKRDFRPDKKHGTV